MPTSNKHVIARSLKLCLLCELHMSQNNLQNLKLEIKQLIVAAANLPQAPEEIDDNIPLFQTGLGLDSIDVLEIVVRLEKKYGLKIRNNDEGKKILTNVESLAAAVSARASSEAS